ncbi:DUF4435 domain-containing protein [Ramlibacter sp. PS4R-6]|uniref:DUF4435 domain-containing protein n=1 Tax=Ramlibacter sp. PS4R-6 TaxID=3133438 RepID=UPI0030B13235
MRSLYWKKQKMAKGLPKRLIEELITRWKLEQLRQVLLEGDLDHRFLRLISRESHCPNSLKELDHIPIDAVHVSDETLSAFGLTQGNKQRVVAVGRYVQREGVSEGFRCIVDADLDRLRGINLSSESVVYTDYACMESYMWHQTALRQTLHYFRCEESVKSDADVQSLYDSISAVCKMLAGIRLIHAENPQWNLELHRSNASLSISQLTVNIDLAAYLTQCKPRKQDRAEIDKKLSDALRMMDAHRAVSVLNGHDLIWLVAFAIKELTAGPKRVVEEEQVLQSMLVHAVAKPELMHQPLFENLVSWAT